MTPLAYYKNPIVSLYVVSGLSIYQIAERYGASPEAVRVLLKAEGVTLRGHMAPGAAVKDSRPPAPKVEATDGEDDFGAGNRKHLSDVIAALNGKGFPFFIFGARA